MPAVCFDASVDTLEIPNRSLFRQPEVCEIAQVQPYVLRSWEAEFPDLGVAKTQGGPRVYRRADVERVLRIKHLLFVEGLTLAGARRKLQEEQALARRRCAGARRRCSSQRRARADPARAQTLREMAAMLAQKPGLANGDRLATLAEPRQWTNAAKPRAVNGRQPRPRDEIRRASARKRGRRLSHRYRVALASTETGCSAAW